MVLLLFVVCEERGVGWFVWECCLFEVLVFDVLCFVRIQDLFLML